jgi:hypothetical protein
LAGEAMATGYIFLFRKLIENPIWLNSTPEQCKILITLLLMANHHEKEWEWNGQKFKAVPGQFITSLPAIVQKCGKGVTVQNVRTALVRFEKMEFLTDESTKTGRLITILNWRVYQPHQDKPNSKANSQLTDDQQTPNSQLTSREECNNNKNNKKKDKPPLSPLKIKYADFVSLTNEEYSSLVAKLGETGASRCVEILDNYKGANGKAYKNDYRAILNWVISRYEEEVKRSSGPVKSENSGTPSPEQAWWEVSQNLDPCKMPKWSHDRIVDAVKAVGYPLLYGPAELSVKKAAFIKAYGGG